MTFLKLDNKNSLELSLELWKNGKKIISSVSSKTLDITEFGANDVDIYNSSLALLTIDIKSIKLYTD